ncbi:MAG: TIGR00730 family Rossman fold protein [Patescibacteria group bacterium]|nr:TIGR00730 family Rossman fold protein [Patescibacteria group bacterium]MDE1988614.1 TIGR00730 family Rossman fold protein [Patescibacteria group bacterium]MDE2217851.1 TIGR00730 family Rossman fold protein [Patescibacteria group bacterium]
MKEKESRIRKYQKLCCEVQPPLTLQRVEEMIKKRMAVINDEFASGFELVKKYPRSVTFFGSSRFTEDNEYFKQAAELSERISKELDYAVVSGGGPGIMEAANKGAFQAGGDSLGLIIKLPQKIKQNGYLTDFREFNFFFSRKVMLSFSAETYVFFPGGFGTMDELFELLTLVQTRKIPRVPIVLAGKKHWDKVDKFIREVLFKEISAIDEEDMNIYKITDSLDEIIEIIKNAPLRKE